MPKSLPIGLAVLLIAAPLVFGSALSAPAAEKKSELGTELRKGAPEEYEPGPDTLRLDAILVLDGSKSALMHVRVSQGSAQDATSSGLTVKEGDVVEGYRVVKIESRRVLLEKDGKTFAVNLFDGKKPASPVAGPSRAAPKAPRSGGDAMGTEDKSSVGAPDESMPAEGFAPGHEPVDDPEMPPPPSISAPSSESHSLIPENEEPRVKSGGGPAAQME